MVAVTYKIETAMLVFPSKPTTPSTKKTKQNKTKKNLIHLDCTLEARCYGFDSGRESQVVHSFVLLANRVLRVQTLPFHIALFDRLETGGVQKVRTSGPNKMPSVIR
jgi:hypothetical protein